LEYGSSLGNRRKRACGGSGRSGFQSEHGGGTRSKMCQRLGILGRIQFHWNFEWILRRTKLLGKHSIFFKFWINFESSSIKWRFCDSECNGDLPALRRKVLIRDWHASSCYSGCSLLCWSWLIGRLEALIGKLCDIHRSSSRLLNVDKILRIHNWNFWSSQFAWNRVASSSFLYGVISKYLRLITCTYLSCHAIWLNHWDPAVSIVPALIDRAFRIWSLESREKVPNSGSSKPISRDCACQTTYSVKSPS
jgi:hypothetical protein